MENIRIYFEEQFKVLSENSGAIVWNILCIVLIVLVGKLVLSFISKITSFNMEKAEEKPEMQKKRIKTLRIETNMTHFVCKKII